MKLLMLLKYIIISLSGGESDIDLLGPDFGVELEEDFDTTKNIPLLTN